MSAGGLRVLVAGPVPPPYGGIARYVLDMLGAAELAHHHLIHLNTSFSSRVRTQAVNLGHTRYQGKSKAGLRSHGYIFARGSWQGVKTMAAGLWTIPRMALLLVGRSPDIVHVFANMHWGFWRAGALVCLARLARRRVVFHPLGAIDLFYPASGTLVRRLISFLLDQADLILVQSPGLACTVSAYTSRPVKGLFNGIDLTPFAEKSEAPQHGSGSLSFLAVGDLGHNKGTWDTLAAAPEVLKAIPDARWNFIGRGDLAELQSRAAAAGVEQAVHFLGSVDDAGKMAAYAAADIFLLPSHAEGQPLSILEAMAAGLPVISTPVGSIAEVITEGVNGFLIPAGDVPALAAAMCKLGRDVELRRQMGKANIQAARDRFDARRLWREIDTCWREMARA